MDFRGYLYHIRREGDLIALIAPHGLDRPVPACPPWDVRKVLAHLATVYDHKVMAMRLGRKPNDGEWVTDVPYGKSTVEWFGDEHAKLLAELATHSPKDFAWSWWEPDQTVGFWYRRMALETVVHRVDVETEFGAPREIKLTLAIDGIDEVLTLMLGGEDDGGRRGAGDGEGGDRRRRQRMVDRARGCPNCCRDRAAHIAATRCCRETLPHYFSISGAAPPGTR